MEAMSKIANAGSVASSDVGAPGDTSVVPRGRSVSPTTAIYRQQLSAMERKAKMINLGLHVFDPKWGTNQGKVYSSSLKDVTLKIFGTDQSMTFPVQTCTQVGDMKDALSQQLMVQRDSIIFIQKRGPSWRQQYDSDEVGRNVVVKGLTSFKAERHKWPHPIGIVGFGYHGMKFGMTLLETGNNDWVAWDRQPGVGGYNWRVAANKSSKLQTELGSFHLWFGQEYSVGRPGIGYPDPREWDEPGNPQGSGIWPHKAVMLKIFEKGCESFGLLPHVTYASNVWEMTIAGAMNDNNRSYYLGVQSLKDNESRKAQVSAIMHFPGSMTRNRIVEYPGEDEFDGHIVYGMNDETPYDDIKNSQCAILGNGAFSVENVRTCCEYGCYKVFLLTRRKNLASPRFSCWFTHQGPVPVPGRLMIKQFEPMYKLCDMGDPWEYFGVIADKARKNVTISQGSRFGIGDVTFLAVAYGRLEYIEDTLKRCSRHTLHLTGGRRVSDVTIILKALGLLGDWEVDKLHKMNKKVGNYCSGDWRRPIFLDEPGMHAANFSTFSSGLGTTGYAREMVFLFNFPKEMYRMQSQGLFDMFPVHKAEPEYEKPAYVADVKFANMCGMTQGAMNQRANILNAGDGMYKNRMYHVSHGTKFFLAECIKSWDAYQATWHKEGFETKYIPYPYTEEMITEYFKEYSEHIGFYCSPDGPDMSQPPPDSGKLPAIDDLPAWGKDAGVFKQVEEGAMEGSAMYWKYKDNNLNVQGDQRKFMAK